MTDTAEITEETPARRVGRPPKAETAQTRPQDVSEGEGATPRHQRRRRASTGGFALKLDAPQRAGFVRRWVMNDPTRIAQMHDLGYDFVQEKASEGVRRTDGMGSRITRGSGKDADGKPAQLILMETPEEEYAVGVAEKEERLKPFEEAIKRNQDTEGKLENAYTPASGRSSINRG